MIKKIKIEGIGVITLNKSERARHVSIRVKPRTGVMVTVPIGVNYDKAIEFVHKKTDWISRQLERTKRMESKQTVFTRIWNIQPCLTGWFFLHGKRKRLK